VRKRRYDVDFILGSDESEQEEEMIEDPEDERRFKSCRSKSMCSNNQITRKPWLEKGRVGEEMMSNGWSMDL